MNKLRTPIKWFGGKGQFKNKIIPLLEVIDHRIYVEPFGGGASILIGKEPVPVETYNDINSALFDFFKVLSDEKLFEKFQRRVSVLPYSRELFYECRENWKTEEDLVKRVSMWFVVAKQCFGGVIATQETPSWGFISNISRRNMAMSCSCWLSTIDQLPEIHQRLSRVQIENNDWRKVFKTYDHKDTLFYIDPPYVENTRKKKRYKHEMKNSDHKELIETILNLKAKTVISGYPNEIYKPLKQNGWELFQINVTSYAAPRTKQSKLQGKGAVKAKQKRKECIWLKDKV